MKTKSPEAFSELRTMIQLRHEAEQRGHYEPLGRLQYLKTSHGNILWPVRDGECQGPDIANRIDANDGTIIDAETFLLLGPWLPLPPIRTQSSTPCSKCLAICEVCCGTKQKQCEMVGCGGKGTVSGGPVPCPGPNCSAATGKINAAGCEICRGAGHIPEERQCPMCLGAKVMTCPRCKGVGKVATGKVGGSTDWKAADCAACQGSGWDKASQAQDVGKFVNAQLDPLKMADGSTFPARTMLALGPIHEFGIEASRSRQTRVFDVMQDSMGDFLMLLVPKASPISARPRGKAYLVGGGVRERDFGKPRERGAE